MEGHFTPPVDPQHFKRCGTCSITNSLINANTRKPARVQPLCVRGFSKTKVKSPHRSNHRVQMAAQWLQVDAIKTKCFTFTNFSHLRLSLFYSDGVFEPRARRDDDALRPLLCVPADGPLQGGAQNH